MSLVERWLASEQRHAMSYERWLEYVVADVTSELEAERGKVAELTIQAGYLPFPKTPIKYRNGCSSAFGSGFECGFRDWKMNNPYTSNRHYEAYNAGFFEGKRRVADALAALQAPQVKP